MANMPAAQYAISRVATCPRLGVGVHLNICSRTANSAPARNPDARRPQWQFSSAACDDHAALDAGACPGAKSKRNFARRFSWMKDRGVVPTHADSHHHMHIYPAAALPFARALTAEGISCARACRCAEWPKSAALGGPYKGGVLRRELVQMYRSILQSTVFRALNSPGCRVAIPGDGRVHSTLRQRWKSTLESLPPGTFELACHPGLFEGGFSETDAIHVRREEELLCLTDRDLLGVIERRVIRLITYRQLCSDIPIERASSEAAA